MSYIALILRVVLVLILFPLVLTAWIIWTVMYGFVGLIFCLAIFAYSGDWDFAEMIEDYMWNPLPIGVIRDARKALCAAREDAR